MQLEGGRDLRRTRDSGHVHATASRNFLRLGLRQHITAAHPNGKDTGWMRFGNWEGLKR
jgi:hypothetical protein